MQTWIRRLSYLWAGPNTLIGLAVFWLPGLGPRHSLVQQGVVCIYGPGITRLLKRAPIVGGAAAMTLGHVILAGSHRILIESWNHEMVHVRQYEVWGPMFLPAYAMCSLWEWLRGNDPYFDNAFERHARRWS